MMIAAQSRGLTSLANSTEVVADLVKLMLKCSHLLYCRMKACLAILTFLAYSCSSSREIAEMKRAMAVDDTSFAYSLPFQKGTSHFLVQGYMTPFSHKG